MCHHYRSAKNLPEHFVEEYHLRPDQRRLFEVLSGELADGGAWPLKRVPALRLGPSGELEAFAAEWGLLPRWWKPSDKQPKRAAFQRATFNARSESVATKPTFRDAYKRRRCLVPFLEFHERGHYFGLPGDDGFQPLAFAGLWEAWEGPEAEVLSVTFLTTKPNTEVRSVGHDRMPVLLASPAERLRWLVDGDGGVPPSPFADGRLAVRPID